jgi:Protein of unknown function (DUF1488)
VRAEHRIAHAVKIDRGVIDEILIAPAGSKTAGSVTVGSNTRAGGPTSRFASTDYWKGSWFMPLTRGKAVGYDADLMAFKFTMRNGQQIVQCQISTAALSDLADRRRGSAGDLRAEFKAHRELIEAIASALFDQTSNEETKLVSIFSKHIPNSRFGRRHSVRLRPGRTFK